MSSELHPPLRNFPLFWSQWHSHYHFTQTNSGTDHWKPLSKELETVSFADCLMFTTTLPGVMDSQMGVPAAVTRKYQHMNQLYLKPALPSLKHPYPSLQFNNWMNSILTKPPISLSEPRSSMNPLSPLLIMCIIPTNPSSTRFRRTSFLPPNYGQDPHYRSQSHISKNAQRALRWQDFQQDHYCPRKWVWKNHYHPLTQYLSSPETKKHLSPKKGLLFDPSRDQIVNFLQVSTKPDYCGQPPNLS